MLFLVVSAFSDDDAASAAAFSSANLLLTLLQINGILKANMTSQSLNSDYWILTADNSDLLNSHQLPTLPLYSEKQHKIYPIIQYTTIHLQTCSIRGAG